MINSSHFNDIKVNFIKNQQLAVSPNTCKHTDLMKQGENTHERKPDKLSLLWMDSCGYEEMNEEVTAFKEKKPKNTQNKRKVLLCWFLR